MGAAHHLSDSRWCVAGVAAWIAAGLLNWVTIPMMFPDQDPRTFITSGALAGLILPLAICGILLDEGPAALIASAGRALGPTRVSWAGGFVASMVAFAWIESWFVPISTSIFVADALFLASATVCGISLVGLRGGWLLPALVIGICSVPGLVPWSWNWVYRPDQEGPMFGVGLIVALIAMATFAVCGSRGLLSRTSLLGTSADRDEWA